MLTALTPGGPADAAGIKAGDVILAINDQYLFTIRELQDGIRRREPGTKIAVRYRRYSTIYDASLIVGDVSVRLSSNGWSKKLEEQPQKGGLALGRIGGGVI